MFWRWKAQRLCVHPDNVWHQQIISNGTDKRFWCTACKFVTYVSRRHEFFAKQRWCRHPRTQSIDLQLGTHLICRDCRMDLGMGV